MRTIKRARFSVPKILFLFFPFLIFLSCATPSGVIMPELAQPQWEVFSHDGGIACYTGKTSSPRLEYYALRIDLANADLRICVADDSSISGKVSSFVKKNNLLAGINALPFDPVSGREGEPRTNIGLVVAGGRVISPPHPPFDALVFFTGGAAAIVPQSEIHSFENIANAAGGFYRILHNYEPAPRVSQTNSRHPRSAAGLSSDGKLLYLLVVDGRRPGSIGSTEAETAVLLRALGACDGINFDGGGSSALALRYPDGKVRVVNTPVHDGIPGRERAVAGCLGVGLNSQ